MAEFDISVKHPEFAEFEEKWRTMRATLDGEDAVKAAGESFLPMKSGIKALTDLQRRSDAYNAYRDRAEFPEIVAPTVKGGVGLIHSKPTAIELPKGMEDLRERATLDGLTLEGLHQRLTTEVMRMGRYGLLPGVDADGAFYLSGYTAETVRNWDVIDGDLAFLVLDETGPVRDRKTNKWATEERLRECYLDEAGAYWSREWIKRRTDKGENEWVPEEPEPSLLRGGKGALPFVPFTFVGSTDLTPAPDDVPLYGLAKLALRAYRLDADYVNALHMTSEPTPWIAGVQQEHAPKTIGASQLWVFPDANAKAEMLEFKGPGIEKQETAITNTLQRAIIFGAQLFADTRRTAESGEAQRMRLGNQQASLRSVAITVASGLEQALRHIAEWGGMDPDQVTVAPNLDFIDRALEPNEIIGLVKGWQAGAYSRQTLFENLQRGEIINPSRTFEEEQELLDADPALGMMGRGEGDGGPPPLAAE